MVHFCFMHFQGNYTQWLMWPPFFKTSFFQGKMPKKRFHQGNHRAPSSNWRNAIHGFCTLTYIWWHGFFWSTSTERYTGPMDALGLKQKTRFFIVDDDPFLRRICGRRSLRAWFMGTTKQSSQPKNLRIAKDFSGKVRTPFPADPIPLKNPKANRIRQTGKGKLALELSSGGYYQRGKRLWSIEFLNQSTKKIARKWLSPKFLYRFFFLKVWRTCWIPIQSSWGSGGGDFFLNAIASCSCLQHVPTGIPSAPYELAVAVNLGYCWVEEDRI